MTEDTKPRRTFGTAGLVFGLLSVFPLGALAGVPAIVLSVFGLREEPRARGRSIAGIVLGSVGIAGTLALMLAFSALVGRSRPANPDVADSSAVTYNMYSIQGSLEDWACENGGDYPAPADFDSDSSRFMKYLARDRVG